MSIQNRKKEHVDLAVHQDVFYGNTAGFERYRFVHNALPEIDLDEVDTSGTLLGRRFALPLFISSMTGGYSEAGAVNAVIARFCEQENLPFGVGSQRAMLEDPEQIASFSVVREKAPSAFIAANIGGAQLAGGIGKDKMDALVSSVGADAIIVHLNPLQELMQPEGDRHFRGIAEGIAALVDTCGVPVMVKETGAGISGDVAEILLQSGVKVIDVAGSGGTSWAKVENLRERSDQPLHAFNDWGIPTVDCLLDVAPLRGNYSFELIASGGIRSSFDLVKSIALGADFVATAQPVIKAIVSDGMEGLRKLYRQWSHETKIILTLLGCKTIEDVGREHLAKVG